MDIYDMLDTIANDMKDYHISHIVDMGDSYAISVCNVDGGVVYGSPFVYPYKPNADKKDFLSYEWQQKYHNGVVLYDNEVLKVSRLLSRFYGQKPEKPKRRKRFDLPLEEISRNFKRPPLEFDIPDYTVTASNSQLIYEIESENCKDKSYINSTNSPAALELIYKEAANGSNLLFSLLYRYYNPNNSSVYEVKRNNDSETVGYIQIGCSDCSSPYLVTGTRISTCNDLDDTLIFAHAVKSICRNRYKNGINYICNANNKARLCSMKNSSGIPVYAVDLNAGPKLNVYYLFQENGESLVHDENFRNHLRVLLNE